MFTDFSGRQDSPGRTRRSRRWNSMNKDVVVKKKVGEINGKEVI